MNAESLIVIRTYPDLRQADEAQVELLGAGIYSLLYTDDQAAGASVGMQPVALAVHRRDADVAEAVLAVAAEPADPLREG